MTTLDTHAAVKDLQAAGFTEPQAEALTRALVQGVDPARIATKGDIENLRLSGKADLALEASGLRAELREAELRLENKIETSKSELQRWMIGHAIVVIGVVAALMQFMR